MPLVGMTPEGAMRPKVRNQREYHHEINSLHRLDFSPDRRRPKSCRCRHYSSGVSAAQSAQVHALHTTRRIIYAESDGYDKH